MTLTYSHQGIDLYTGDVRAVLPSLADESVQCVVTSPPFFQLRDYGTATWEGGREGCDHRKVQDATRAVATSTLVGSKTTTGHLQEGYGDHCRRCGARRIDAQIGLEQTPDAYVAELVAVFREVRRVLRGDGVCWLELGDSYAGAGYSNHANTGGAQRADGGKQAHTAGFRPGNPEKNGGVSNRDGVGSVAGCKPKDLIGIPWMTAFALRADGWYLRSEIIWHRPNPMPESVRDRPTTAHSRIFLLSKREKYFYDADAIAEPVGENTHSRYMDDRQSPSQIAYAAQPNNRGQTGLQRFCGTGVRNARSVWTITPQPFPGAHFATFPEELAERCILAGSRPGDVVLDPFSGAGTTALVAKRLERRAIGVELNPVYVQMSVRRLQQDVLPLWTAESSS